MNARGSFNVPVNSSALTSHKPKNNVDSRHKVIRFGVAHKAESEEEEALYKYHHQRADLKETRGIIPVGFLSTFPLDEGQPIYLETRSGGLDERGAPLGPQYQVTWKLERELVGAGPGDGWSSNLDDLWMSVVGYFERKNLLSEDTLDYLDADPFVLFGIDDAVSQQALRKLDKFPALLCEGATPNFDEWSHYLRIDPMDSELNWLVRSFSETDLPKPWTCYKGVGCIVCYIRSDTGQVTWKHPFYDYFRQLRDFCRGASREEVMQVRSNRLLWSYEATRVETEHDQDLLISPEYVARMADIFGYDVKTQGCVVRNIKAQLKVFARCYRETQNIDIQKVLDVQELLQRDVEKHHEMTSEWQQMVREELQFDLNQLADGELQCVNCGTTSMCFCLECRDYLCLKCYDSLHSKGARLQHSPFRLVACSMCVTAPAKLHCTFTDLSLCHKCYAMKHIKVLPPAGKENQPRRIDYVQQYNRYVQMAKEKSGSKVPQLDMTEVETSYDAVLSTDWHPFYDARGVKFYHNFSTGERMRQSPRRLPSTAEPGAEAEEDTNLEASASFYETSTAFSMSSKRSGARNGMTGDRFKITGTAIGMETSPLPLKGFDSLKTETAARDAAAMQPDLRNLRPPHRTHLPCEVPVS